jgi:hypothetical protein
MQAFVPARTVPLPVRRPRVWAQEPRTGRASREVRCVQRVGGPCDALGRNGGVGGPDSGASEGVSDLA